MSGSTHLTETSLDFFWPANLEASDQEMCTYRFTVVPFGSSSSPFMLGAVLNLHLSKFNTAVA